jgi:four helix bundle protein
MEYTKRRNLNRVFMKLDGWQRGMDLFDLAFRRSSAVPDFKLKSQFADAVQPVSANVAEGYGRRSLAAYLQFLYLAKGSLAEACTRVAGLWRVKLIPDAGYEEFDQLHYEVENKLLHPIESLEAKRVTGDWQDALPHLSNNPTLQ